MRIVSMILFMAVVLTGLPFSGPFSVVAYGASSTMGESDYPMETTVTLDGRPASGVEVELHATEWWNYSESAVTNAQGKASFGRKPSLDSGKYYFKVAKTDKHSAYDGKDKAFSLPGTVPTIELTQGYTVETTVTLDGRPMPDVWVKLYTIDAKDDISYVEQVKTDTQGKISFGRQPSLVGKKYYFFIPQTTSEYSEYDGKDKAFSLPGKVPTIELDKGCAITATVTVDGIPRSDVKVILKYNYDYEVTSDANGKVTFSGLPANTNAYFKVEAADDYMAYKSPVFKLGVNPPAVIPLKTGNRLSTTVTYMGQPVKNKWVTLRCIPFEASDCDILAMTDENGVAVFEKVPDGDCYFIVKASESDEYANYDGKFYDKRFTVPGDEIPSIELEEGHKISFQVSLENGKEIKDLNIKLFYRHPREVNFRIAQKNLRGSLGTNPTITFSNLSKLDNCYIQIEREEGQNARYYGDEQGEFFSIPGNAPDIVLKIGESGSVRVTMNGLPRQGVYVRIRGTNDIVSSVTKDDGIASFTNLSVSQKAYLVVGRKKGEFAAYNGANKNKVFSTTDGKYPDIELEKGGAFTARFLDHGKPLTNIEVDLYQIDAMDEYWNAGEEKVNQSGVATFTNIVPGGNYYFVLSREDDDGFWIPFYDGEDLPKYTLPADITIDIGDNSGSSTSSRRKDKNDNSGNWNQSYTAPKLGGSAPAPISGPVNTETAVNLTREALKVAGQAGNTSAVVKFRNVGAMTLATARAIGEAAGTTPVKIHADSTLGDGTVDVRLTLSPAQMTKDIDLSASTVSERAKSTKALFGKWFKNRLQVISFTQQGSFGMPVEIAVKPDKELDQKSLYFYHYDKETNSYKQIPAPNYWMDENGYLHFTTSLAGDVIITDAPLQK
ncbi:hypothetical protein [Harryflintia acetispora]|nr:hypothetical protein [Harryflintia acetispora]